MYLRYQLIREYFYSQCEQSISFKKLRVWKVEQFHRRVRMEKLIRSKFRNSICNRGTKQLEGKEKSYVSLGPINIISLPKVRRTSWRTLTHPPPLSIFFPFFLPSFFLSFSKRICTSRSGLDPKFEVIGYLAWE